MPRSDLTVQQIARTGIVPSYAAANALGNSIPNDGQVFVHIKNGAGAPINVTVLVPALVDSMAITARVVAVANGSEKMIGPFPPGIFNQPDGKVYVDYSSETTITVAAIRL
jgi:hypothetical protein